MDAQQLLAAFKHLNGSTSSQFDEVCAAMRLELRRRNRPLLNELLAQVAMRDDPATQKNFDCLLDTLCMEPEDAAERDRARWRVFAAVVTLRSPAGVALVQCSNYASLEHALADFLSVPSTEVRVMPMMLPTAMAYDFGPAEAYAQCQATRLWAEGADGFHIPARADANAVLTEDREPDTTEAVLLIAVRLEETDAAQALSELDDFVGEGESLHTLSAVDARGEEFEVVMRLTHVGGPWHVMGDALHSVQALAAATELKHVCGVHQLAVRDVQCVVVYVENADGGNTTRVSFIGPQERLLSGLAFANLHEPEVFVDKLETLLALLGGQPVRQLPQTCFDIEADDSSEHYRFLVPGQGWQALPPDARP